MFLRNLYVLFAPPSFVKLYLNEASEKTFQEKIKMELTLNNPIAAEKTTMQFKQKFPLCEEAYLSALSIYFTTRAYDKLTAEIAALKASPITLSNKALTTVRYWSEVNQHNELVTLK